MAQENLGINDNDIIWDDEPKLSDTDIIWDDEQPKFTGTDAQWKTKIINLEGVGDETNQPDVSPMGKRLQKRYSEIGETVKEGFSEGVGKGIWELPKTAGLLTGQAAGVVNEVIGTGIINTIKGIWKAGNTLNVLPESTKASIKEYASEKIYTLLNSDFGKAGLKALETGVGTWKEFERMNPDGAKALEGLLNITALTYGKKGTEAGTEKILNKAQQQTLRNLQRQRGLIEKKIGQEIKKYYPQAIKPSKKSVGKSLTQNRRYYNQVQRANETIVANKNNLGLVDDIGGVEVKRLPESLLDYQVAIDSTKRKVFEQYDEINKVADDMGTFIDLKPIADHIDDFAQQPQIQDLAPNVAKKAMDMADSFRERGTVGAAQAQDYLQVFNARAHSFLANPTYDSANLKAVDDLARNLLKRDLDNKMSILAGTKYEGLKMQYSALRTIEEDVSNAAMKNLSKHGASLVDIGSDIFSGVQAAHAIARREPKLMAASITARLIAAVHKKMANPDRKIRKMFENIENLKLGQ